MNRKSLLFFTSWFLIFTFRLTAQNTWIQTYQPFGDVDYFVEDVIICQDEGYAINGYYYYYDSFPPPIEEQFGFLMKTDSNGNFEWSEVDNNVGFEWNQSSAFVETDDEGFLCSVYSDYGGSVLVKRDSEGNQQWVESCGDLFIHSMDNTSDGDIILGGRMNGLPAIRKITQEADIYWTQTYYIQGSGSGCIKSIISLTDNGYAVTGWESSNGGDVLIMKTDANGDSLWTKTFDGYGDFDQGKSISEGLGGKLVLSGDLVDQTNFIINGLIWLFDAFGNTIFNEIAEINTGFGHYSIICLPYDSFTTFCYIGNNQSKIYNFDSGYNIEWESIFDCVIARGDRGFLNTSDSYVCSGVTEINWDEYIALIKTDSLGQYVYIDEYEITPLQTTLNYYPNPFNPIINFEIKSDDIFDLKLRIFNVKGQLVKTIPITGQKISWDASGFASGIYLCNVQKNQEIIQSKKITLMK